MKKKGIEFFNDFKNYNMECVTTSFQFCEAIRKRETDLLKSADCMLIYVCSKTNSENCLSVRLLNI